MSKKHPGRNTEFAKWKKTIAKLDFELKKEAENRKKVLTKSK